MEFDLINYLILIVHVLSFIVAMDTPFYMTDTTYVILKHWKQRLVEKQWPKLGLMTIFPPYSTSC